MSFLYIFLLIISHLGVYLAEPKNKIFGYNKDSVIFDGRKLRFWCKHENSIIRWSNQGYCENCTKRFTYDKYLG